MAFFSFVFFATQIFCTLLWQTPVELITLERNVLKWVLQKYLNVHVRFVRSVLLIYCMNVFYCNVGKNDPTSF